MIRCRPTVLPLALLALISCTGTSVDLTPIVANSDTTSDQAGDISSNIIPISTATDLTQIEGRYTYDNDECAIEQRENTSPNLSRLNAIRSQSGAIQFVVTLNPEIATTTTTTTIDRTIDLLDLTQGTTRKETLQVTESGTFTSMTLLTRRCGLEFVAGGAVATCHYSDVPATCTWYLIRR